MYQCACGGLVSIAELTLDRQRYWCKSCGRYEVRELSQKRLDIYAKSAYIIQPSITARPIDGGSPLLGVSLNTSQGPGDWTTSGEKT